MPTYSLEAEIVLGVLYRKWGNLKKVGTLESREICVPLPGPPEYKEWPRYCPKVYWTEMVQKGHFDHFGLLKTTKVHHDGGVPSNCQKLPKTRKHAEYFFESTVSEKRTHSASLSFGANSVSSAKNSVSSLCHTNSRLRGTH